MSTNGQTDGRTHYYSPLRLTFGDKEKIVGLKGGGALYPKQDHNHDAITDISNTNKTKKKKKKKKNGTVSPLLFIRGDHYVRQYLT